MQVRTGHASRSCFVVGLILLIRLFMTMLLRGFGYGLGVVVLALSVFGAVRADAATLEPATIPVGVEGTYYQQAITASSTLVLPIEWSIISGSLPPGIALGEDEGRQVLIKGTPTIAGTYSFRVRAKDADQAMYERPYSFVIERPMTISPGTLPQATVGLAYTATFAVTGGTAPYHWSLQAGSMPPGLSLNADTGQLSGTSTAAGSYAFTLQVRSAYGVVASRMYTLVVVSVPVVTQPTITTTSLPGATLGASYVFTLTASGGAPAYSWSVISGSLPSGLSLGTNGTLQGSAVSAGNYAFTVRVRDTNGNTADRTFALGVQAHVNTELEVRLANFARIGVRVHDLVKLADDGNRLTQADSAVYYLGSDGRRHAFSNEKVYFSWYTGFGGVRIISGNDLASVPLGVNVTYRPGVKMVKFMTDPKVYAVAGNRSLRWVGTEAVARDLYGASWNRMIDDISDAFYPDYVIFTASPIMSLSDFNPASVRAMYTYPSEVMP